jgi:predicted GIY-YIG superfamily endonuclease
MVLELPRDLEAFADEYDQLQSAAVYALDLTPPDDVAAVWDRRFEERPAYWDRLVNAETWVYVGASGNVLHRLEDHREGKVRKSILPTLAEDMALRNVWFQRSSNKAFERESAIAIRLRNHLPSEIFVHYR